MTDLEIIGHLSLMVAILFSLLCLIAYIVFKN